MIRNLVDVILLQCFYKSSSDRKIPLTNVLLVAENCRASVFLHSRAGKVVKGVSRCSCHAALSLDIFLAVHDVHSVGCDFLHLAAGNVIYYFVLCVLFDVFNA